MSDKKKILNGRNGIMAYIGIASGPLFMQFIKEGMPARLINGRWYAHTDNLDDYFKRITFYKEKNPPEDAE